MNVGFPGKFSTPLSNSTLLPLLLLSLSKQRHTPACSNSIKDEYDYIIVGGGAAGSVVAARLSEKPCVSVLLLEAGPKNPLLTEVPALARYFRKSEDNWKFSTVPQKYTASGLVNRQIEWMTGKMLGGSGSLNGMAYVRGNWRDYDNWAANGAKGWTYSDVFPYFLKLEDNRNPAYLANGYHAVGGPITVDVSSYYPELKEAIYEAATELGYDIVDSNAGKQSGFYALQSNIRDDQRCSSVKGYLVPAESRRNLNIFTNAMVTKIVIEDGNAKGVEFQHKGKPRFVKSRNEVIVSAGTENTPKILMLSGIGPKEELEKWNISVIANLPVGRNLHDDAGTHYIFTLDQRYPSFDEKISAPSSILEYIDYRTGPLASVDSLALAFMRCLNDSEPADYPDYEIYFVELTTSFGKNLGLKPEVYKQIFGPYENRALFSCSVQQLQPKSRGTITLSSSNPFDPPLIDPNYLQDPSDFTDIVEGLKTCKKILNTAPLLDIGAKALETVVPGCESYFGDDDAYFRCIARTILFTFHHPVGTSKMGDPADPTTVVDPELRVKSIKGLRVVDASIMPVVTAGNTYIPTLMIAEKASDMIKDSIICSNKVNIISESAYLKPWNNSPLLLQLLQSVTRQKHTPDCSEKISDEYDYIVVGGGTAGSVVASRLSEESCVNVLLLEAGPKPPLVTEVPKFFSYVLGTDVDWKYKIVPQKYALTGLKNRQIHWHAGKMLGGSGNHNAMIYIRGNRKNYDDWAAQGAKGWSYEDVFPYFLKLEDNRNLDHLDNGYHTTGGPITVERTRFYSKVKEAVYDAISELGYEIVDSNGATQTGFHDFQINARDGQRCSAVKGYLVPAEHRTNLDILVNAAVTKIIFQDNKATGVTFYQNGKYQEVRARKEVIISAGALNTPKILMLSGIGPKEELEKLNIPVKANLPVGRNLQDHGVSYYYFTVDSEFGNLKRLFDAPTLEQYIHYRSGPLSTSGDIFTAFLNNVNLTADFPNYQLFLYEILEASGNNSRFESKIYKQFFEPIDKNRAMFACTSQHLQPKSRGTVTLNSTDPFDSPVIDPNYLADPQDLEDVVDGLKTCKRLLNSVSLQRVGAKPFETVLPGCEIYVSSDEEYFRCFARRIFETIFHPVGTAKMGDPMDPTTVVDSDLRVKGIERLRVVDASVMPIIPSGNTHIPTIMVAEKASDIIKRSIKCLENKF